jgi:hypothetical protein
MPIRVAWALLAAVAVSGCERQPAPPPGTGARKATQTYYEALMRQEWEKAYSLLDADSRTQCSGEQFSRLAQNYRNNLGFEPDAVHIQTCDEQGAEATARIVWSSGAAKGRRYKDAISLRRTGDRWQVVLPQGFGR